MNIKKLCAALSALCMANAAFAAQTLRVVSRAEDKTGVWVDAYMSIADAIAAASDGTEASHDTILVASGTYNINSTITVSLDNRRWLVIRSANLETDEEDREGTILDGGGAIQIMKVQSAAVRVSGFTFQNGSMESAAYSSNGAAAIQITRHKVVVDNCVFRGNRTVNVAGTCVSCSGGSGNLTVSGCIFTNNTQEISVSGSDYMAKGVAIYSSVNTVTVNDCLFDGNNATAESANGLLVSGSGTGWHFDNCTFLTNTFTRSGTSSGRVSYGGSVNLTDSSTMRNCRFSCNAFNATGSDSIYGSVLNIGGTCTLSNCTLTSIVDSNNSDRMYGTIYVNGNGVSFLNCAFTDNTVGKYFIEVRGKTNTLFRNCLFADNVRGTTAYRLIRQTNCPDGSGLVIENCTFVDNTDSIGDTKVHIIGSAGTSSCTNVFVNSVFTGLLHPHPSNIKTVARNCCFGPLYDNNFLEKTDCFMISDVPGGDLKFIGVAERNYQLQRTSPLREKGIILPWMSVTATDIIGNLRVVSNKGEPLAVDPSALPDIGCYECVLKPLGLALIIK